MDALYGKQIDERNLWNGDKLEIYFDSNSAEFPFTLVVNDLSAFPCVSWQEVKDEFDHFCSKPRVVAVNESALERIEQYAT
jgi:hypothetical protein